jgi:hypothetical protein
MTFGKTADIEPVASIQIAVLELHRVRAIYSFNDLKFSKIMFVVAPDE